MSDFEEIKNKQQNVWASGDFSIVAWNTLYIGEKLCEAVDFRAGQKILDVATGSGNTALSAARRFGEVTGIDYVPALIEKAKERSAIDKLPVDFRVADCENMPFPDGSFDVVLSTFGSMFAPDHEKAAQELLRVCKPNGKIGLANWSPEGFWGEIFRLRGKYIPPEENLKPPGEWGTEQRIKELFENHTSEIKINKRTALFRYKSVEHFIEFFKTYFGPILKTFEALDEQQQNQYQKDIEQKVIQFNQSGDNTVVIPAEYLEIVMVKK